MKLTIGRFVLCIILLVIFVALLLYPASNRIMAFIGLGWIGTDLWRALEK